MWMHRDNVTVKQEGECSQQSVKRDPPDNLVPVMIGHIKRHGEDLSVWGQPVKRITIVAIVSKVELEKCKVNFEFRDETGTIKGVKWLETQNDDYVSPVNINSYARVFGSVRSSNEGNFILILHLQPLDHLNELLMHLMEVTYVCLDGQKQLEQSKKKEDTTEMEDMEVIPGMSLGQNIIMNIVKSAHQENGFHRNEIKSRVPKNLLSQVDEILNFLMGEGHIYTTTSDDDFKSI